MRDTFVKPLAMKPLIICALLLQLYFPTLAQQNFKTENVFIITLDGFRWQEVFSGADPAIIGNPEYVNDTSLMRQLYMDQDPTVRRKQLMPFFWSVIAEKGQLYGNRTWNNKVDVKNFY